MILLLFYLLSILCWMKGKRAISLVFLYAAITNGFNLKILATNYDLTYLSFAFGTYAVFSYLLKKGKELFVLNVENSVVWLYIFLAIHFLATVFLSIDSLKFSFIVFRQWGLISIFLLFRNFSVKEIDQALKWIFLITIVWLILYYLQLVGINLFIEERFLTSFKRNTPYLSIFFAIYAFYNFKKKEKWLIILPFLWTTVTSGSRGALTGLVLSFVVFYAIMKKSKQILIIGLIFFFGQTYITKFLSNETFSRNGEMSFLEELKNGFNTDYKHFHGVNLDGTFAYRTLYLSERIDYLLNHPQNIPFGVGSIYETSPNNYLHFFIQHSGRIETDDLFWAAPLLRYGFIGISLYIIFFFSYFRFFARQNLNDKTIKTGTIFFLFLLFTSMNTWSFTIVPNIMVMGMYYYKAKKSLSQYTVSGTIK